MYLVAQGGVTESQPNNANINLVNIIGEGPTVPTSVTVNEATTVAAYQTFTNDWTNATIPTLVQTPANTNGMAISFSTYQSMVNEVTGEASGRVPQLLPQAAVLALCVQQANNCDILAGSTYLNTSPRSDTFSLMTGLKVANSAAITRVNSLLTTSGLFSVATP